MADLLIGKSYVVVLKTQKVKTTDKTQKRTPKAFPDGVQKDVCLLFSHQVCKLFDLSPLCPHTRQVSWRCPQLPDYCCHNCAFTTSISKASMNVLLWILTHSRGVFGRTHDQTQPQTTMTVPLRKPRHLAKHGVGPLMCTFRRK